MKLRPAVIIWIWLMICPWSVLGQENKSAILTRLTGKIVVDGVLNEPAWSEATELSEIRQREPLPGQPATERTEVKLLYDNHFIYIGVVCYDSDPDGIIGTQMARDASLFVDDQVEILLDTYHDRRNAFYFATNPLGALVDGLIIEGTFPNREWDAIWTVKTKRFAEGWRAEFAIPFRSLSFKQGQNTWGFNFSRTIRRKIEEDRWSAPRLDVQFYQVSEAGEITGFDDIEQGRGLDIRPYFLGKYAHDPRTGNNIMVGKFGGEVFYNVTSNLKWTTTINTDFAETEVDNRQINLTRFPLFFPEKRAFFLENAGAYSFSNLADFRRPDVIPFFSRRIGLVDGQEVPIQAGSKLTGKVGRYDLGLLGIRTRETAFTPAKNYFVGRVKRNLFEQSYVGGIYTEGNPTSSATSRMMGADVRLSTANFLGLSRNFSVNGAYLKTQNEGVKGDDNSYGFGVAYPNDRWDVRMEWRHNGREFDPALGFVARPDTNKLLLTAEFNPRPKSFLNIRQMFNEFRFWRYTRASTGEVENWRLFTAPVNWRFNSGDRIEFNWTRQFERLFNQFEISDGLELPKGNYTFTRWRAEFSTAPQRPWQVQATWWFGTFYSGHADEIEASFSYRLAPHVQLRLNSQQTFARLKEGRFVARIFELQADYAFTPYVAVSNLIQFDNASRNIGWQSRLRWIMRPGNDLFLVFNQGWEQDERLRGFNFMRRETRLAGKVQYTFRF